MTANPQDAVATMRQKLAADEYDVAPADVDVLLEMSDHIRLLGTSEYSHHRHEFLLRRNLVLAKEVGGLAAALEDRDAAEAIVAWINTEQTDSVETNKDYRVAFRGFGKLATDGDDIPDTIEWVPGGYPSTYDPAPNPAKMLRWETDVLPMIDACANHRDKALIALAFDAGPRPGELYDLTVDSIADHKYGLQLTVDGKRGRRSPVLVPSVPYVNQWLQLHPRSDDPGAPLFCDLRDGTSISNNRVRDILKERASRADVTRPVTPRNFRKSSASHLASKAVSQAHLEDHHGWRRGSKVASRYIAVFGDANDREIAKAHGVDVEEDKPDPIGPIDCPRCDRETPREQEFCVWCNQALSQGAVEEIREQTRETRADLLRIGQEHPEILDDIASGEDLVRLIDERPETLDEAEALLDALAGSD
jgi:integrase